MTAKNPTIDTYPTASDWARLSEKQTTRFKESPIPESELLDQIGVFASHTAMRRFLFWDTMYRQILEIQGDLFVFGVRWGRDLAALQHLRTIYEPMNFTRRIFGFDTFSGLAGTTIHDGSASIAEDGTYGVTDGYEKYLSELLLEREALLPFGQLQKTTIVKGDARITVPSHLKKHPQTIVAFAYFDMDIYEPTHVVAKAILPFLNMGAIIGCDQLAHPSFPGETIAIREVFGSRLKIQRSVTGPGQPSYFRYNGSVEN